MLKAVSQVTDKIAEAIVMLLRKVDAEQAKRLLDQAGGRIARVLANGQT